MTMTDQQRQIVAHFASFVPTAKRALFEVIVMQNMAHHRDDGSGMQTARACIDAMRAVSRQRDRTTRGGGSFSNRINGLITTVGASGIFFLTFDFLKSHREVKCEAKEPTSNPAGP
jgi:hypothetical protein